MNQLLRWTAQHVYDLLCLKTNYTLTERLFRWRAQWLRALLIRRCGDPLVRCRLERGSIWIPLSNPLALHKRKYPQYSTAPGRLARVLLEHYPDLAMIDIGANVGDTVAMMPEGVDPPTLAVEGEERFFTILKQNCESWPHVVPVKAFIGEENISTAGKLEQYIGTAKFTMGAGSTRSVTLAALLKEYPAFERAKLLKIDTDGYDLRVMRGAKDWIADAKPVLFFEYDPEHWRNQGEDPASVFPLLRSLGYTTLLFYTSVGNPLVTCQIDETRHLDELISYFEGQRNQSYADIAAFHGDDEPVFEKFRQLEFGLPAHAPVETSR